MSDIDIHNYPEGADPKTLWRYQAAVMNAAADGKPVQVFDGENWSDGITPHWNWVSYSYRIARDPLDEIAPGHNPHKLTVRQVGGAHRLVSIEEQGYDAYNINRSDAEIWSKHRRRWEERGLPHEVFSKDITYRTTKPPGYYLPKPTVLVPWTLETVPKGRMWIREQGEKQLCMATRLTDHCIDSGAGISIGYSYLLARCEHSLDDAKTWHPCGVLEGGAK